MIWKNWQRGEGSVHPDLRHSAAVSSFYRPFSWGGTIWTQPVIDGHAWQTVRHFLLVLWDTLWTLWKSRTITLLFQWAAFLISYTSLRHTQQLMLTVLSSTETHKSVTWVLRGSGGGLVSVYFDVSNEDQCPEGWLHTFLMEVLRGLSHGGGPCSDFGPLSTLWLSEAILREWGNPK